MFATEFRSQPVLISGWSGVRTSLLRKCGSKIREITPGMSKFGQIENSRKDKVLTIEDEIGSNNLVDDQF